MSDIPKLPLSNPNSYKEEFTPLGSQHAMKEYVRCLSEGIGFTAHAPHYWHYKMHGGCGFTLNLKTKEITSFDASSIEWIRNASKEINKKERANVAS